MMHGKKIRIGDLLVSAGEINEEQLHIALAEQKSAGKKLGRVLIDKGFIPEERFLAFLSQQLEIPFVDLKIVNVDTKLVNRLPEMIARRYRAIVLAEQDDGLLQVGMADPMDIFAYDEIARRLKQPVNVAVVRESEVLPLLDLAYRRTGEIEGFAEELEEELGEERFSLRTDTFDEDDSSPVARMLRSIMEDAIQIRASDIHIEPGDDVLRIRQRVDGALQEQIIKEAKISAALVSRLKLMSGLDISEKRLPQDGRFTLSLNDRDIDIRLSTMPVQFGESVVMRILDHSGGSKTLDEVGIPTPMVKRLQYLIHRPNGLILVTGPTGSGKTTTLYGALNELNSEEKKIITVEDPVEYQLERVSQVQVNAKIGLTFASVLRAALRQDPDVLLLGEIRDKETAEIALRASMTGHLVLSTLHTNDAISSATRLLDIGIEGYLAASTLRAVIAQRLVRRICVRCSSPEAIDSQQIAWLGALVGEFKAQELQFFKGQGCPQCNKTGYRGRIPVFELLEFNEKLANTLRSENAELFVKTARAHDGYRPLVLSALDLAVAGTTSLSEVLALSGQVEDLNIEGLEMISGEQMDINSGLLSKGSGSFRDSLN